MSTNEFLLERIRVLEDCNEKLLKNSRQVAIYELESLLHEYQPTPDGAMVCCQLIERKIKNLKEQ